MICRGNARNWIHDVQKGWHVHYANIGFSCIVIRLTSRFCSPITVGRANDDTQSGILVSGNRVDVTYDCNMSPLRTTERELWGMETAKLNWNKKKKKRKKKNKRCTGRSCRFVDWSVSLPFFVADCRLRYYDKKGNIGFVHCVVRIFSLSFVSL